MSKVAAASNYEMMTIIKDETEVRLEGKTVAFDYYESILSPNITANIVVLDTGNSVAYQSYYDSQERLGSIYNALPLTGREKLKFKIRSESGLLDFSQKPLFVNGIANPDQNGQREAIMLSLFSEGAKLNSESTVIRKYQGNIGDSVEIIINQFLTGKSELVKVNKANIQKTTNAYNFIGNSKSVFEICCNLGSKSVAEKDSAGFFFFETQDGFQFKSIDNLVSQASVARYFKSDILQENMQNSANDVKILSCAIRKNQNILNAMDAGVFFSRNIYFNPKTFEETEIMYQFSEGRLIKKLGKSAEAPDVNAYTKTHYNILDIGTLESTVEGGDNNDPNDYQAQAAMRYNILFSQLVDIQVPCNPNLRAGDTIDCDFEIITQSEKEQGSIDPVQSGKYLIVDLCHHYEPTRSITSLTLARDSYGLYTERNKS
jgi:hypothetical protein